MVIGQGMLARNFSYFENDPSVLIFASGVSDSTCTEKAEYLREIRLVDEVIKTFPEALFVYFSTTAVHDVDLQQTDYVKHKLFLTEKISRECKKFIILRVSNVVGLGGNKKNLLSYFIHKLRTQENFEVWSGSYRNLIGVEELFAMTKQLISDGEFLNQSMDIIAPQSIRVVDLVEYLGKLLGVKPRYNLIERGASPAYDHTISDLLIKKCELNMASGYQEYLIDRHLSEIK